jgi:hypothetical protein
MLVQFGGLAGADRNQLVHSAAFRRNNFQRGPEFARKVGDPECALKNASRIEAGRSRPDTVLFG